MSLELGPSGWTIAEGNTGKYKFDIRIREFAVKPNEADYPQRLNIFWAMSDYFESGYPTEFELQRLHQFENRLTEAVEKDEFSIMSMVLTGNGEREFVFHTADPQEFVKRLSRMPQEQERYPIQINQNEDKCWQYYYDELAKLPNA